MHHQAATGHQNVRARERAQLAQWHRRALVHDVARRQFARAEAGIGEQRAVAALDINPAVGTGRATVVGQRVELLFALAQVQRQCLETLGALLKVEGLQGADALMATVLDGFGKVQALLVGARQFVAVDGTAQHLSAVLADPAASDKTLQGRGVRHHGSSGFKRWD